VYTAVCGPCTHGHHREHGCVHGPYTAVCTAQYTAVYTAVYTACTYVRAHGRVTAVYGRVHVYTTVYTAV